MCQANLNFLQPIKNHILQENVLPSTLKLMEVVKNDEGVKRKADSQTVLELPLKRQKSSEPDMDDKSEGVDEELVEESPTPGEIDPQPEPGPSTRQLAKKFASKTIKQNEELPKEKLPAAK